LENGANPNVVVTSDFNTKMSGIRPGDSVTHMACRTHFPVFFELVFNHGGDPNLVNEKALHDTPLFTVIKRSSSDKIAKIKRLAELGADLNYQNGAWKTPASQATTWGGQYDVTLAILEAGADHRIYKKNHNSRLVHTVIAEGQRRLSVMTPQQKVDYEKLVKWLKDHGESFDEARADIERWNSWVGTPKQIRAKREREIRERKRREAKKKQAAKKQQQVDAEEAVAEKSSEN